VADSSAADLPIRPSHHLPSADAPTLEVVEAVLEVLDSPAAAETVAWLQAKAEAEAALSSACDVVAHPVAADRPLRPVNEDEAGPA